jgi:hypothetical protein
MSCRRLTAEDISGVRGVTGVFVDDRFIQGTSLNWDPIHSTEAYAISQMCVQPHDASSPNFDFSSTLL